jgi:O-antigen ligase
VTSNFANKAITVAIFVLLMAGDFVRNALTVPVWIALVVAAAMWSLVRVVRVGVALHQFPIPLLVLFVWWALTPIWSPYPGTSLTMLVTLALGVLFATAIVVDFPLDEFVRRAALSLRIVLVGSILFELVVALIGRPVYPVGFVENPSTPIELAWSRGLLFSAGRIQGLVGNANTLGMLALVLLIIGVWRMFASRNWRTVSLVDTALAVLVIARTASATVTVCLLALAVVLGITALARRTGTGWRIGLAASIVAILGSIAAVIVNWTAVVALLGKSPDLTHRLDIWTSVVARISERPIVGSGYVGWWPTWDPWFDIQEVDGLEMAQAHNVWLDVTMQSGVVGVTLFALCLGTALWSLWRAFAESSRSVAAVPFLVLVSLTVQSLTESRLLHEWGFVALVTFAMIAERLRIGLSRSRD